MLARWCDDRGPRTALKTLGAEASPGGGDNELLLRPRWEAGRARGRAGLAQPWGPGSVRGGTWKFPSGCLEGRNVRGMGHAPGT